MAKLQGVTDGLRATTVKELERLYQKRIPRDVILDAETAETLCRISREIRRQIGLVIDRNGKVEFVIAGTPDEIMIPDLSMYRNAPGRLRGLRVVHTHLKMEGLTKDDLTDLALLRLDLMCALCPDSDGDLDTVHVAHVLPGGDSSEPTRTLPPEGPAALDNDCARFVESIEAELGRLSSLQDAPKDKERAILVSVSPLPRMEAEANLEELRELAESNDVYVIASELQLKRKGDPKTLMGRGRLDQLYLNALQSAATIIIFDQELTPAQVRNITARMDLKVIDRTQLILDIFARRAQSREGKLQVELAQLKYLQPRLVDMHTAMSRLTGGIGGRGPGETKLELNRRRVRDQINRLEKQTRQVQSHRQRQKGKRNRKGLPVFSIIGYTNAGKSTLLNTMTQSEIYTEDQMFATLDPTSRRLRFPHDVEVIITDTVGFIRDLPKELMAAFKATLEELEGADILLHVVDASNPEWPRHLESVSGILEDLGIEHIPEIRVFNKMDACDPDALDQAVRAHDGVAISARSRISTRPLIERMEHVLNTEQNRELPFPEEYPEELPGEERGEDWND